LEKKKKIGIEMLPVVVSKRDVFWVLIVGDSLAPRALQFNSVKTPALGFSFRQTQLVASATSKGSVLFVDLEICMLERPGHIRWAFVCISWFMVQVH
jgi:hypothetical protein